MGHEDVLTLYASSGQFNPLWHNNYTALSVFLDSDRVITQKFNTDVRPQIEAAITAALSL